MVGVCCAVAQCKNSYGRARKYNTNNPRLSFHRFPANKRIRKQWIILSKRAGKFNPNTSCICSEHFKPEDFSRDLQAELLGYAPKNRLHPTAIPSRNIPNDPNILGTASAIWRLNRMEANKELMDLNVGTTKELATPQAVDSFPLKSKDLDPQLPPPSFTDMYDTVSKLWVVKLRKLDQVQRVFAENLISQILTEAYFQQLTRNHRIVDIIYANNN